MSTEITPNHKIKEEARAMAKAVLVKNRMFSTLPLSEQRSLYLDLVNENINKLSGQQTVSRSMAGKGPGADMGFGGYDPGLEGSVDAFDDLVDTVNFPKFVADLLKGVFDANISVMKAQTDSYIKLMKEATKPVTDFIKKVKDDDTFAYLADKSSNKFNITMEDDGNGGKKMALTNPEGEKVDMEDNEVKAKIMEAKIAMAREHRAALREVILMGVTRLVVEKGEVDAAVEFRITSTRASNKANSNTNINEFEMEAEYGGGLLGGLFGGPSGSMRNKNTNINISTSNKDARDEMFAKLMGKVNIKFKTDYFKLDNFANMYADGGVAALKPPAQGGPAGALPAK